MKGPHGRGFGLSAPGQARALIRRRSIRIVKDCIMVKPATII